MLMSKNQRRAGTELFSVVARPVPLSSGPVTTPGPGLEEHIPRRDGSPPEVEIEVHAAIAVDVGTEVAVL
jgi:hypothetical protein